MENLFFYLEHCPYCKKAQKYFDEAMEKRPELKAGFETLRKVEESKEVEFADSFDYHYVPTIYVKGEKIHEGAMKEEEAVTILEKALASM